MPRFFTQLEEERAWAEKQAKKTAKKKKAKKEQAKKRQDGGSCEGARVTDEDCDAKVGADSVGSFERAHDGGSRCAVGSAFQHVQRAQEKGRGRGKRARAGKDEGQRADLEGGVTATRDWHV